MDILGRRLSFWKLHSALVTATVARPNLENGDEFIVDQVTRDVGSGRGDDDASSARHDHTEYTRCITASTKWGRKRRTVVVTSQALVANQQISQILVQRQ